MNNSIARQVRVDANRVESVLADPKLFTPFALFECVFFKNKGYLSPQTQLVDDCSKITHIPLAIVHGRQDVVCRPAGAWRLHKLLPLSTIEFVADAGHSNSEPGTEAALVRATNAMKTSVL
jgi:proline iminopeptidase